MSDKVIMRSPDGERKEVEATPEALSPLMARGWVQADEKQETEVTHAGEHP